MTEWRMIALMVSGVACWTIGGTGFKWTRRFLFPVIAVITLIGYNSWWVVLGVAGTMIAANCLPYGDACPWVWPLLRVEERKLIPAKIITLISLGASVIWLDPIFGLWWALGTAIVLTGAMILSRTYSRVTWKCWEGLSGFLQATGIILGVLR